MNMSLTDYVTLGRSGLRVSPLCFGTMTFGTEWGWGTEEDISLAIFDRYIEAGGNFLDTADGYTAGKSEEMLGKFVDQRKLRDRVVVATKFTMITDPGNPNAGGNGRKNLYRALEGSLRRLRTDSHRPLLAALLGYGHSRRGSGRDAQRPGVRRENPALWFLGYACVVRGPGTDAG